MTQPSYCILVIPDEHKGPINRVLNALFGDSGDNLSQPLSANGADPATYWYGGWPVTAEQANQLQGLGDNMPVPDGGWPYMDVTEEQAVAAVAALYLNVNTGPTAEDLPAQNRATVFAALSIQPIVPEV